MFIEYCFAEKGGSYEKSNYFFYYHVTRVYKLFMWLVENTRYSFGS